MLGHFNDAHGRMCLSEIMQGSMTMAGCRACLDGEDHAHKAGGEHGDPQRIGPNQLQLIDRVPEVGFACRLQTPA